MSKTELVKDLFKKGVMSEVESYSVDKGYCFQPIPTNVNLYVSLHVVKSMEINESQVKYENTIYVVI